MTNKDLEAALDACLDQLHNAESIQACLTRNPEQAAELEPLLRVAAQLKALGHEQVPVPPGLKLGRQRVLNEAARRRSADLSGGLFPRSGAWLVLRRSAVALALSALMLVAALGGGTIALAARSLPGDTLYPVKRMAEGVQLVLTLDPETKAQLTARFDERRRTEAVAIAGSHRIAEISFRGQADCGDDERWVVSGVPVYLSAETEIEQGVEAGTTVRVQARSMSDGKLWARRITLEPVQLQPPTPTMTVPAPTLTRSATPTLEPTATFTTQASPTLRETRKAGAALTATPAPSPTQTRPLPSATPTATPIPPSPTPAREVRIRFKGKIDAIEADAWTVGGQVVRIDTATRINDQEHPVALGVTVTVVATRIADGGLLALEITTERPEQPSSQPFEFRGIIESYTAERWIVGGQTLIITGDTVIEGRPQRGLLADVKAVRYADGSLTAKHIAVSPPTEDVEFEGTLEAISGDEWVVDGTHVRLDDQTEVVGEPRVGAHVEVQGLLLTDGAVLARRVRVQALATVTPTDRPPSPAEATPTTVPDTSEFAPTATPEDALTPDPEDAVSPTPGPATTALPDSPLPAVLATPEAPGLDAPSPLSSLAIAQDWLAALAPEASARREEGSLIEFRGLIQEVGERYWLASGRIVFITEDTRVHGTPEVGALAEIKGVRMFGNTVLAHSVEIARPELFSPVQFEGTLESMWQQTWVVGGVTVTISSVTVILGTPALGLVSEVQGVLQADGSVRADRVVVGGTSAAPQIDISGLVEYIEPLQWTVSGTTVLIDERTFIDESRASAEVGMWAQIRAVRRQHGTLLAVRIVLSRPN